VWVPQAARPSDWQLSGEVTATDRPSGSGAAEASSGRAADAGVGAANMCRRARRSSLSRRLVPVGKAGRLTRDPLLYPDA